MKRYQLTFPFEVLAEDMTSERRADYRQVIVNALVLAQETLDPHHHGDELEMIDGLLEDCNR